MTTCPICGREFVETTTGPRRHACADRCGAWMPTAQEPCAKRRGHPDGHRTAYALDNAARMRRGAWAVA